MASVVVLASGGVKSATAAARYAPDHDLVLLHVNYGQTSAAAQLAAVSAMAPWFPSAQVLSHDLPAMMRAVSKPTVDRSSRKGSSSPAKVSHDDRSPGSRRGLIPVLHAVGLQTAFQVGAGIVAGGFSRFCDAVHLGFFGPEGKPDSLHEFIHAFDMMSTSLNPHERTPCLAAPLADVGYREIVKLAQRFEIPLERTWSCEEAGPKPCRSCTSCKARARAFIEAARVDPLQPPRQSDPESTSPDEAHSLKTQTV